MSRNKPRTRTAASAPRETSHLSTSQQKALEAGGEAEHAIGPRKEKLIRRATQLGKQGKPKT
jgi:hypothetical protein